MADIIHSYCSTCLIIESAPFRVCCDAHIEPTAYLMLSVKAGYPNCKICNLKDKIIINIDKAITDAIQRTGGYFDKKAYVKINNKTIAHLLEDHGRQGIVFNIVPQLVSLLPAHDFVAVMPEGKEIQYFISYEGQTYKVPVVWQHGDRWLIPSIYSVTETQVKGFLDKPKGEYIFGKRKSD